MRSGTTILANFLNSQKGITIYRDFLVTLRDKHLTIPVEDSFKTNSAREELLLSIIKEAEKIDINLNLNKDYVINLVDIYKSCLDQIAHPKDKIVGNKCTQSLFILEKLLPYTNIYSIYIVRDIRDVVISTKQRNTNISRKEVDPTNQFRQWKKEIATASLLQKKYPDRFLMIKYEDFIQKRINKQLEVFLGQPLDWGIKKFKDRSGETFIHNSSFNDFHHSKGLSQNSISRWKKQTQDKSLVLSAQKSCWTELVNLGYASNLRP